MEMNIFLEGLEDEDMNRIYKWKRKRLFSYSWDAGRDKTVIDINEALGGGTEQRNVLGNGQKTVNSVVLT